MRKTPMENPYSSPHDENEQAPRKRPRVLETLGIVCIALALVSFSISILLFWFAANELTLPGKPATARPSPSQVAGGIHVGKTIGFVVMPLGLVGLSLYVTGHLTRNRN